MPTYGSIVMVIQYFTVIHFLNAPLLYVQACNVAACGYDAGDCGTDNYHLMQGFMISDQVHHYTLAKGQGHAYASN